MHLFFIFLTFRFINANLLSGVYNARNLKCVEIYTLL